MRIGWYIHHHGRGHLQRFLAVAPRLGTVTALTSLSRPDELGAELDWIQLPLDVPVSDAVSDTVTAGGLLHWAPLGTGGYRDRMAQIAAWVAEVQPDAIVVDVSVEVALLGRLLGVPVIWIAQRGRREDSAHRLAYASAERIIAPWTSALDGEGPAWPDPGRVSHIGALSRFDGRVPVDPPDQPGVALILGFGGHAVSPVQVADAARMTPGWRWQVAGLEVPDAPANLSVHAEDCDIWALLGSVSLVIAAASANAVAEAAAARRPLLMLAQARPFDEQEHQARVLADAGLATRLDTWPEPERWPAVLASAARQDPSAWAHLHDGRATDRLVAAIHAVAGPSTP